MKYLIFTIFLFLNILPFAQPPKHEIRGVWLTTAWRLDWPSTIAKDSVSAEKQRRELVKILDHLYFLNFNTVFLQVRMRNDLIYPSQIEPWSAMLSGKSKKSPGYDALAFAIEECHKRGLECHAWMVTIPIGSDKQIKSNGNESVVKKHPELCKRIKGEWFLDPGIPETGKYLTSLVSEITQSYDIDGIHLDYLRYPEIGEFPDNQTYNKYGNNLKKADWRRENITQIESSIFNTVKNLKNWVQVSSSPIGKRDDLDSVSSHGWNGKKVVYQDVKTWFDRNKHDFVAPMLYFKEPIFKPFLKDWKETTGAKPVSAGIALYMMDEHNWSSEIIENEINYTREIGCGQTYFRAENLLTNTKMCSDILKQKFYLYPALLPTLSWIENNPPSTPEITNVRQEENFLIFDWKLTSSDLNLTYNLYVSKAQNVNTEDVRNMVACRIAKPHFDLEIPDDYTGDVYFVITANDRFHNESRPSKSVKVRFPEKVVYK
ncbi:MAG: family 10 glycosylhydrolase [Bacteroidales bacterium]